MDNLLKKLAPTVHNPFGGCIFRNRNGRQRPLGIPTVRDRIVQTAAKIVLEPIFEANFRDCSYGFRPKLSAHGARQRIRKAIQREQCRWVVDADIVGFFDNLNRGLLMRLVRRRVNDRRMLRLLWQWLDDGVMEDGSAPLMWKANW
jgi:retron-type reverse transcriptase